MKEFDYTPDSWQHVTTEVKMALEIKTLTSSQASQIMRLYIAGTCTEEIIKQMKGETKLVL